MAGSETAATWSQPRALDAVACSILAVVFVIHVPGIGLTPFGDLSLLYMVPVVGLCGGVVWLIWQTRGITVLAGPRWRVGAAALMVLGLGPFVSWWSRFSYSGHFAVGMTAAVAAGLWLLRECIAVVRGLAQGSGRGDMVRAADRVRVRFLYLLVAPVGAFYVAFVGGQLMMGRGELTDLERLCRLIPLPVRWLTGLPIVDVSILLLRGGGLPIARSAPAAKRSGPAPAGSAAEPTQGTNT